MTKFRKNSFDKKNLRAKKTVLETEIIVRLSEEQIEFYRMLII